MSKQNKPYKIAIVGPESSGKTTLSKQLALHFNCLYTNEYARAFLTQHAKHYTAVDLDYIAQQQLVFQQQAITQSIASQKQVVIFDTSLLVIKVWSELVYNSCSTTILNLLIQEEVDYYLLCNTEPEWEYDELREAPSLQQRQEIFSTYHAMLSADKVPFYVVNQLGQSRVHNTIQHVQQQFNL